MAKDSPKPLFTVVKSHIFVSSIKWDEEQDCFQTDKGGILMSDSYASEERNNPGTFKEAVCIDAMRVYDSCSDKDYARYVKTILANKF